MHLCNIDLYTATKEPNPEVSCVGEQGPKRAETVHCCCGGIDLPRPKQADPIFLCTAEVTSIVGLQGTKKGEKWTCCPQTESMASESPLCSYMWPKHHVREEQHDVSSSLPSTQ
ncbi:hypothetical protein KIL84_018113 [Mauremys mutica]|uniref:Uncharacterized protein n=1 Tax=Mauremys mutica TaxID=74926 RepID=A0A9D3XPQ3_9SAUR|nr:hypothetical protein KIL84_018113 [Mauremys mutica]